MRVWHRKSVLAFVGIVLALIMAAVGFTATSHFARVSKAEAATVENPTSISLSVNTDRVLFDGSNYWLRSNALDGIAGVEKTPYNTWLLSDGTEFAVPATNMTYYAFISNATATSEQMLKLLTNLTLSDGTNTEVISCATEGVSVSLSGDTLTATYKELSSALIIPNMPLGETAVTLTAKYTKILEPSVDYLNDDDLLYDSAFSAHSVMSNGFVNSVKLTEEQFYLDPVHIALPTNFTTDDIKYDSSEGKYYYINKADIHPSDSSWKSGSFVIRAQYAGVSEIELSLRNGTKPTQVQTALTPFLPVDINANLKIGSGTQSVRLTNAGVLDADGFRECGLGKFKVYHYKTGQTAPTPSDGADLLSDETHTAGMTLDAYMTSAIHTVRIVFVVEKDESAGQLEQVVSYKDFDVTGIRINPAATVAATVNQTPCNWQKQTLKYSKLNGADVAEGAAAPYDGYGAEISVALPTSLNYRSLWDFLIGREIKLTVTRGSEVVGVYGYEYNGGNIQELKTENGVMFAETENGGQYFVANNAGDYTFKFEITGPDYKWDTAVGASSDNELYYSVTVNPMKGAATLDIEKGVDDEGAENTVATFNYGSLLKINGDVGYNVKYQPIDTDLAWTFANYDGKAESWTEGIGEAEGDATETRFTYSFLYFGKSTNGKYDVPESAPSAEIPTTPGTYYAIAKVEAFGNYAEAQSEPIQFVIKRQAIAFSWKYNLSNTPNYKAAPVYNEGKHDPSDYIYIVNESSGEVLTSVDWSFYTDGTFTAELADYEPITAGKHTLYLKLSDEKSDLYEWSPETVGNADDGVFAAGDNGAGKATLYFEIDKFTGNTLGVSIIGWTYGDPANRPTDSAPTYYYKIKHIYVAKDVYDTAKAAADALTGDDRGFAAKYIIANSLDYTVDAPENAGEYFVLSYITSEYGENNDDFTSYNYCEAEKSFTVAKKGVKKPSLSSADFVYNKNAQTVTLSDYDGANMTVAIKAAISGNTSISADSTLGSFTATNADIYTITVTIKADYFKNHKWDDSSMTEAQNSFSFTWTVKPYTFKTIGATVDKTKEYSAAKHSFELSDDANASDEYFDYALISASVSGNPYIDGRLDTSKNFVNTSLLSQSSDKIWTLEAMYAGKYVVTLELEDTNYIWNTNSRSYELTFDLTPVKLTSANVEWGTEFTYIYDGDEHKPAPSFKALKGADTLTANTSVTQDGSAVSKITEVGSYVMTVDGMSGSKLSGVLDGEDYDVAYGYVMPESAENVTYHGFAITSALLLAPSLTDDTVEYVGSAYEIVDCIKDYAENYIVGGVSQIRFVAYKNGTEAVGGTTPQETLSLTDVVWKSFTAEKATIGSYTVEVVLRDPDNYKWKATAADTEGTDNSPVRLTFRITPALIDFALSTTASKDEPYSVEYNGKEHSFSDIIIDYGNISSRIVVTNGAHTDVNRTGFGEAVNSYAVTVALEDKSLYNYVWSDGSSDPTQGYNIADKAYYMRVEPTALEVTWGNTEASYTGASLSPSAEVKNHFDVAENKALTLTLEFIAGKGNEAVSGGVSAVTAAGYYTAYVANIVGDGAENYKIDFSSASLAGPKTDFTILRREVVKPTFETELGSGNSLGEYDKKSHSVVIKDYDSSLMSYAANAHDARGKTDGSIDVSSSVSEDGANKKVTVAATRAGDYFVTFTLSDTANYCYEGESAAPDAENENSVALDFKLERKAVNAPTLARSATREAGKVLVPVLYSTYGAVPSEKQYVQVGSAASTVDFDLGGGWVVSADIAYGNTTEETVGVYGITLTLSALSDGESTYDYRFVKEYVDENTMSTLGLEDILSGCDTVLTVQYRITGSVFELVFTIQDSLGNDVERWTYGDGVTGFRFHTASAVPNDYVPAQREAVYYVYDEDDGAYVAYDGERVSTGTDDISDKANFFAELPKSAGRYRAAVVYRTGDSSGNGVYEYEQRYIVDFTVEKSEIEFEWKSNDDVKYDGVDGMFTATYDGNSHMGYAEVTNAQYEDKLGLQIGLVGDNLDNPKNVKLDGDGNATYYDIEIKGITGDAFANYVLPTSGLNSKLTIEKRSVTLKAADFGHVFGSKTTSDGANLNVDGADLVSVTDGNFVASDSIDLNDFAVTAKLADGANVLYNTTVGNYRTVITPRDELTDYDITYVDGIFEVWQKVIEANWNSDTFIYDGTDRFAGFDGNFVWYVDIDGNKVGLTSVDVTKDGASCLFKDAGSYTFAVTGLSDTDYRLAVAGETEYDSLTRNFDMNKRTVAIAAKDIETAYGDDVNTFPFAWEYVGGTDKFVEDGGSEIEAGSSAPSVLNFGFASTAVKASAVGGYTTYIVYGGVNFTGTIELDNFTVNVSSGTHTIVKYELKETDIIWAAKQFTYNAKDQTTDMLGIATFTDRGDGATRHSLSIVAVGSDGKAAEFKNAGDYTLAVCGLQSESTANLKLPSGYDLTWQSSAKYTIAKREVEIAVEDKKSVYGEKIGSDKRIWNYVSAEKFCDDDDNAGDDGFVSRINVRVSGGAGTDDERTNVGVHALELCLDEDKFTAESGRAEFDNYSVAFANGKITVRPRVLNVDVQNLEHTYGDDGVFALSLVSRMVSVSTSQSADGGLTSFDTLDDVLVATSGANPDGNVRASIGNNYTVTLSLETDSKGNNYIVKFKPMSAAGEVGAEVVLNADVLSESSANISEIAAYYNIKAASFEGISVISYSASGTAYDGVAHAAISSVSVSYFTAAKNEDRKTATGNAADNSLVWTYALASTSLVPANSEFGAQVPEVLNAGTYYLYYRISADNHETKTDYVTVVITKKQVVLSVSANVYYGEETPELGDYTYKFDGLGKNESITYASHSGNAVAFKAVRTENGIETPLEGWTDGTVEVSTDYTAGKPVDSYAVDVGNIGFSSDNYSFVLAAREQNNIAVEKLPVIIKIGDITDRYWFNGEDGGRDLNVRAENGFALTTGVSDIKGNPITDIYAEDKTDGAHAYAKLFFIKSGAFAYDSNDNRIDMNGKGVYSIAYERRELGGADGNYDLSFELGNHTVTNADIVLSLDSYAADYDEDGHGALVSTSDDGVLATPVDKERPGGASKLDYKYALHKVEEGDGAIESYAPAEASDYDLDALPVIIDAGTYYVYYLITADNHEPAIGSAVAVINKTRNGWKTEYEMGNNSWSYGNYSPALNSETKPVANFKRIPGGTDETLPEISLYGGDGYATLIGTYSMSGENWSWLTVTEEGASLSNGRLLAAGSYKAVVKVEGNDNFFDLENEYEITVNKAELLLTPKAVKITYGDALDFSALTYEIGSFRNNEDFSQVIRNEALNLEAGYGNDENFTLYEAGFENGGVSNSYYIRFADGVQSALESLGVLKNYAPKLGTATLTVERKQLTVHINDAENKYNFNVSSGHREDAAAIDTDLTGAEDKTAFGYYYDGENRPFAYGSAGAEVPVRIVTDAFKYDESGALTGSTSDVGTYAIYAEENKYAANYDIAYVGTFADGTKGRFEIKQAELNIKVSVWHTVDGKETEASVSSTGREYVGTYSGYAWEFKAECVDSGFSAVTFRTVYRSGLTGNDYSSNAPKNAGTYYVRFITDNDNNYTFAGSEDDYVMKVDPLRVAVDMKLYNDDVATDALPHNVEYKQSSYAVRLSQVPENVPAPDRDGFKNLISISYRKDNQAVPSPLNAGAYLATATVTELAFGNYVLDEESRNFQFTIEKKKVDVVTATGDVSVQYGGNDISFALTGCSAITDPNANNGYIMTYTIEYTDNLGSDPSTFASGTFSTGRFDFVAVNAGGYAVKVKLAFTDNYEWRDASGDTVTLIYTITKKTLYVKAANEEIEYGNSFDGRAGSSHTFLYKGLVPGHIGQQGALGNEIPGADIVGVGKEIDISKVTFAAIDSSAQSYTAASAAGETFTLIPDENAFVSNNYAIAINHSSFGSGILRVVGRRITVEIKDVERTYTGSRHDEWLDGELNASLADGNNSGKYVALVGGTLTSNEHNDTLAALGIKLTIGGGNETDYVSSGYAISATHTNTNYDITFTGSWSTKTDGTFTVLKKTLDVSVGVTGYEGGSHAVVYGDSLTYNATYSGFVPQGNIGATGNLSALSWLFLDGGKIDVETVRTSGTGAERYTVGSSHVGDAYKVTLKEITLQNYKFNVIEGAITVAPRTVSAAPTARFVVFAADAAHKPVVQNVPVAFTNTVPGFASNIFTYSYDGTLKDGTSVAGLSDVSKAGDYVVTINLAANANGSYDYLFASGSSSYTFTDSYEIRKQVVRLEWTTQTFEFSEGRADENTIPNYDATILDRSGIMLGGSVDMELDGGIIIDSERGLRLPVTKSGSYSIVLSLKAEYQNDYILVNRDGSPSQTVTPSFNTFVSEINLTISMSGWTYGDSPVEPKLKATEAGGKEFVLGENATIAIAYALLSDETVASLDKGDLWNKSLTQNDINSLAGTRTYGVSPVNAGAYMVRATGSVEYTYTSDDTGATETKIIPVQAWFAFRINKDKIDVPVFDASGADKVYGGGLLSATVSGYREGIMGMTYAEAFELKADAVGGTSTLTLHTASAGKHELVITLINTVNYEWQSFMPSEHTKLDGGNIVITWTVSSGANVVTGLTLQTGIFYGDTYDTTGVSASFGGVITYKYAVRDADSTDPSTVPEGLTWSEGFPRYVGKYWISATPQSDENNYVSKTAYVACEIVKAVLTVRAKDATVTYGDAFTIEGNFELLGARYDNELVLDGLPSVTVENEYGSYFVGADVGTYVIRISGISGVTVSGDFANNYTVSFDGSEQATLTVNKKPITVIINSQEATYDGTANHVLDETMGRNKGWYVLDDALVTNATTQLLDTLGIALEKPADSINVGNYPITYSLTTGGKNANYNITVTPSGRFIINPLTLTVTEAATSGTLTYAMGNTPDGDLSLTVKYMYGGSERTLTVGSNTGSTSVLNETFVLRYSGVSNSGVAYTNSPSLPLYAGGSYTVSLIPGTNSGNIVLIGASAAFAVEKYTVDGSVLQDSDTLESVLKVAYTGNEYSLSGDVARRLETLGSALYPMPAGVSKLFAVTASAKGTSAGTYAFTLTLDASVFHNYKWRSVEVASREFTFEITQASNFVRWTNVNPSELSWIYDGTLHEGGLGFTADFGASTRVWLVSASENGNYEEFDASRLTRKGKHYVNAYIPATSDYEEEITSTFKVCDISAREIRIVFAGDDEFIGGVYGDATMTPRGFDFTDVVSGLAHFEELKSGISTDVTYVGRSFGGVDCKGVMPTLAGRYKVRVSLGGESANNFTLVGASGGYVESDYIIARQAVYGDGIVVDSFDFDGFAHTAEDSVKGNEFYGVKYALEGSAAENINADNYAFVLGLIDPDNFYWFTHTSDRISATTDAYRTFTYSIRRVDVVNAELDKLSFVKNGTAVEVSASTLESEAILWTYKDNISDVSATVKVTVRAADGREYELKNRTYGTFDDFIELQYLRDGYAEWGRLLPEDAGAHKIRVNIERTVNINAPSSTEEYDFRVEKLALEAPTLGVTDTGWTYTGERLTAYMSGSFDNDIMRVSFSDVSTEGGKFTVGAVRAGTHEITVDIRQSYMRNYMWKDGSSSTVVKWKIEKAPNRLKNFNDIIKVYGQSYESEAKADFGTVKFAYYDENGVLLAGAPRAVGDYFVEASVDGSDDYYGVAASRVKLRIDKKEIVILPASGTVVYGNEYAHDARGFVVEDGSFEYGDGYSVISGAPEYYTAYRAGNAAGSAQTIAISGVGTLKADNYTFKASETHSVLTVTKRPITVVIGDQSASYNGEIVLDQTAWSILESTPKFGSDIIAVTLSIDGGLPTSVGRYRISGEAVVGGNNSNENYDIAFRDGTYVVNALIITIGGIDVPSGLVFGETAGKKATFTVDGVEGSLESGDFVGRVEILVVYYDDTTGITYSSMPVSAGTYRAMIELAPASEGNNNQNYRLGGTLSKVFTIARRAIDESAIESNAKAAGLLDSVYSGYLRAPSGDALARIEGFAPIEGMYTASCAGGINVGEYSLVLTFTSDFVRNYKWMHSDGSVASLTYTIVKNTDNNVTASFKDPAQTSFEYDGEAIEKRLEEALAIGASFGGDDAVFEYASVTGGTLGKYSRTVPSSVGDYRVRVVIGDTQNYSGAVSAALKFEIAPRRLKAAFAACGGTYMSVIVPASATLSFADENFDDARLLKTAEHVVYYYGTSYDGTFSHVLADENDVIPVKAGEYKAALVLRNSNFVFVSSDGTETSSLEIDFAVARIRLEIPSQEGGKYDVDDTKYTLTPAGFDAALMTISGNSATNNGDYTATVSLKDKYNYEWANGTSDDVQMSWTLKKAAPVDFIVTVSVLGTLTAAAGALLVVMLVRRKRLG